MTMNKKISKKVSMSPDSPAWSGKVSNSHQLGGIETSVLDNGNGRGTRIAWFDTGSGLRFKVLPDRAMDIADAFFNQHSLAWLSHSAVTPGNPAVNRDSLWLDNFSGGLLVTCGLTHVGDPEKDQYGERGLHDRISHLPARIESVIQPDLRNDNYDMSITGTMLQSTVFGPNLELKRTISGRLGVSEIKIHDEVTNLGNQTAPHMLLYHMNFGWPLIDEGTKLIWNGKVYPRDADDPIFSEGGDCETCKSPLDKHSGGGSSVAFIDIDADKNGYCRSDISNPKLGLRVSLHFKKEQLPWLTNWQHWGRNEYVTGMEPGTHPPKGQAAARKDGTLLFLEPGETKYYDILLKVE